MLIAVLVGAFLWWRSRRRNISLRGLPFSSREENIPLTTSVREDQDDNDKDEDGGRFRSRKGKEKAGSVPEEEAIFDVGSDDEDERSPVAGRRS